MSSQRTKLACSACSRRKVKCSKTVPCSNCIRRGEQDTCSSDIGTAGPGSSPASSVAQREVNALRSRILELEEDLRSRNSQARPPRQDNRLLEQEIEEAVDQRVSPGAQEDESRDVPDPVIEDAASILEFLAWGRRKNPDYNSVISPEASADVAVSPGDVCDAQPEISFLDAVDGASQIASLQLLLPTKRQLWELVHYHEESLLWFHCSYYAPVFRNQVDNFYSRFNGSVESRGINLQWLALLFAVLSGSITCAPSHQAQEWGFRPRERETLSRRWFRAVHTCLNAAEYAANHSILSVQAISTLTICAHLLGFSNDHSIHLAAAVRVAQSLGLHRISDEGPGTVVDKECGRRLWSQLCCQDWFSIPFSETYLINPLYSHSTRTLNCNDEDMLPLPPSVPTITSYTRLLTRIASIMPRLQDDLMSCNTLFTKYEEVIKWDKQMRSISTAERPLFLSNIPIETSWPCWIPFARRSLAITSSHKIIMIHRCFLSESFTNPAFSFTRRTCLAASKTIIKEFKAAIAEEDPILWTHQAFSVAASIILILDVLHRVATESEYSEHKRLVEDTLGILRRCQNSMIANRGVKLLSALLEEVSAAGQAQNARKRRREGSQPYTDQVTKRNRNCQSFSVTTFVASFCNPQTQNGSASLKNIRQDVIDPGLTVEGTTSSMIAPETQPLTNNYLDSFPDLDAANNPLYSLSVLEGATTFENLLYLANHDFT